MRSIVEGCLYILYIASAMVLGEGSLANIYESFGKTSARTGSTMRLGVPVAAASIKVIPKVS